MDADGLGSISDAIRSWAKSSPDAIAISSVAGPGLTYAGLSARIDLVELELRALGIAKGDRVAVVLDDGPELATAFLGIASAAACAPLNPAYREQELDFYLSDLGASAVVIPRESRSTAVRAVAQRLGSLVIEVERVADGASGFALRGAGSPPATNISRAGDIALLLHTSGTTARPKLVPLTHANLCASAAAVATSLALTPEDRGLAVMPLFHIHGLVASVLAPLAAGSTVVCTPGFDPARFAGWLDAFRPTWYTAVPTMHMAVLERAQGRGQPRLDTSLRLVRSSSAALPMSVSADLETLFGCPVIEAYGMTEASHQMAVNPLPPRERKPGSVGLPAGPEIAVLAENGDVLGVDELGEVGVRGPGVFAGYERDPEADREAFTNGWFRTGDQGYLDADGYLFLRGRLKEIINRGGEKVSPREVEEAVLAHPAVADAVVFAQPHDRLGEDVATAVVLREGASRDGREIQQFVASRLAPFKVPATVVFLDELPKGPTGKVQRVGLSERLGLPVLGARDDARPPYAPPRSDLEKRLCALWEELLEVERVGIHDDFIALGGDSLLTAQLFAAIEQDRPDDELLASSILWAPTVERLAALIEEGGEPSGRVIPVEPGRLGRPFYFFPTHDWGTVGLAALGRRLGGEHSVHTLQIDPDDRPRGSERVDDLAAEFLAEIRAVQGEGPYALGGICFGAGIALEIARALLAQGEQVEALTLVNPIGERVSQARISARWILLNARRGTLVEWLGQRRRAHRQAPEDRPSAPAAAQALERAFRRASREYRARSYPGEITVLAGADYTTPRRFWEGVAGGGMDWREIPRGAGSVFGSQHLAALAAELDGALARTAGR